MVLSIRLCVRPKNTVLKGNPNWHLVVRFIINRNATCLLMMEIFAFTIICIWHTHATAKYSRVLVLPYCYTKDTLIYKKRWNPSAGHTLEWETSDNKSRTFASFHSCGWYKALADGHCIWRSWYHFHKDPLGLALLYNSRIGKKGFPRRGGGSWKDTPSWR